MTDTQPAVHPAPPPPRVHEARISRATAPTGVRLWWLRRWRWEVIRYGCTAPTNPGVWDGRNHLWTESGYTFTWLGAALHVADEITRRPR